MRDFTYARFETLLQFLINHEYCPVSLVDYFFHKDENKRQVIMRHDVDRHPTNALKIAKFEHSQNICSSYYFRYPSTYTPIIIKTIAGLGHEIGYHYEVLSKANGDVTLAFQLFREELAEFRKICEVKTCCAHGSPLSSFDNRTLFSSCQFSDFDLIGDAHLSVSPDIPYFSDTGRSWGMHGNMRDRLPMSDSMLDIQNTDDLERHLQNSDYPEIYLVVHPERWNDPGVRWYLQYGQDILFNAGKRILRKTR